MLRLGSGRMQFSAMPASTVVCPAIRVAGESLDWGVTYSSAASRDRRIAGKRKFCLRTVGIFLKCPAVW